MFNNRHFIGSYLLLCLIWRRIEKLASELATLRDRFAKAPAPISPVEEKPAPSTTPPPVAVPPSVVAPPAPHSAPNRALINVRARVGSAEVLRRHCVSASLKGRREDALDARAALKKIGPELLPARVPNLGCTGQLGTTQI